MREFMCDVETLTFRQTQPFVIPPKHCVFRSETGHLQVLQYRNCKTR